MSIRTISPWLFSLLIAAPAFAVQTSPEGTGGPGAEDDGPRMGWHRGHHHEQMLEQFDADGDGQLSDEEKANARAAFAERLKEEHPEKFAELDNDGDGELSEDEMKAMRKRGHRFGPPDPEAARQRAEEHFAELDADADGTITKEEFMAAAEARIEHRTERHEAMRAKMLERFDADGDGELNDEERAAMRQQMRERHGKRGPAGDDEPTT